MSIEYDAPPWAHQPASVWRLIEIKSGVQIAQHNLNKPCMILGRASDQVDITLQHESSSRQHARIAFDSAGTPWLRDLQSSHGSVVNKKRVPDIATGRTESHSSKAGARGVILYPGDVLQFGASTRIYCLEGPVDFERGAIKAKAAMAKQKAAMSFDPVETKEVLDKCSTGNEVGQASFGVDAGDDDTEIDKGGSSLKLPHDIEDKIDEKHRKEWEKLRALKYKLENVRSEAERIRRKGELSEGQEKQLQRNDEREQKLQEEIDEKEAQLHRKLFPGKHTKIHSSRENATEGVDEDVDDFYDRTKDTGDGDDFQDGETEESLKTKWKADRELLTTCRIALEHTKLNVSQVEAKLSALQANGDEEAFFVQNDLALAKEKVEKAKHEKHRLQKEMAEAKRLLKIVNPRVTVDEATGYIGEGAVPSNSSAIGMLPPPSCAEIMSEEEDEEEGFVMPPPMLMVGATTAETPACEPDSSCAGPPQGDFFMPPPKRQRAMGPTLPPGPRTSSPVPVPMFEPAKKTKVAKAEPPKGTLSVFSATAGRSASLRDETSTSGKDGPSKKAPTVSDPRNDAWQAPKDQDGSGITKLNAKFAGRY